MLILCRPLKIVKIQDIAVNAANARLYTERLVNSRHAGDVEDTIKEIELITEQYTEDMNHYQDRIIAGNDDVILFERMQDAVAIYHNDRENVMALAREGKFDEAYDYNMDKVIPAGIFISFLNKK